MFGRSITCATTLAIASLFVVFESAAAATRITLNVPIDAEVRVNNLLTRSTGEDREFVDSNVEVGRVYRYHIQVSAERDKKTTTQERLLRLRAGETAHLAFVFDIHRLEPVGNARTAARSGRLQRRELDYAAVEKSGPAPPGNAKSNRAAWRTTSTLATSAAVKEASSAVRLSSQTQFTSVRYAAAMANPAGYIYTGKRGTHAFDITDGAGNALYKHLDGFADVVDLTGMLQSPQYFFFFENNLPGWYWALAKHPTWVCDGCHWYCLGYRVVYVQDAPPNPARIEFQYYAHRSPIEGVIPHAVALEGGKRRP